MIKVEHIETFNWEGAIRGMRNPMNSWSKSDTDFSLKYKGVPRIGDNDLDLMRRLRSGGADDRKFMRQLFVCMDITASQTWWSQADQYKIGTVTNSCSKMHKLTYKPFSIEDFSHDNLQPDGMLWTIVDELNKLRDLYLCETDEAKKKSLWNQMLEILPLSFMQKRTWTGNYEVLANMYHARRHHKLSDWREFCGVLATVMPYSALITGDFNENH